MIKTLPKDKRAIFVFCFFLIILLSAFLRFYHLSQPADKIFDEVYFPVFAQDYLTHTDFFDAHPPLGKLIIAGGIATFGNIPFGWRVMNALAGLLLLVAVFGLTYELTKRWQTALLAFFLIAIEPMALVESRAGLINIYLALFSILGLWFFWRWYTKQKLYALILALVFFACATAVKWIGIGAFASSVLFWIVDRYRTKKDQRTKIPWWHIIFLLLIPLIYVATFIPDLLRHQDFIWWHKSAFNYHAHLKATHPYGSSWWSWAFVLRPIWLYYKSPSPHVVIGIIDIGNVITWIGGLAALLYMLLTFRISKEKRRNLFLILTYLSLYLPWILISRVKFIYHYFDPVIILLIILAIVLEESVLQDKRTRWFGYIFLGIAYAFFVYFLPLLMGLPISETFYRSHMWLRSWI